MQQVMKQLEKRTAEFKTARLFDFLKDKSLSPQQRLAFAPCAAHFEMSFADVCALVLREEPARDKYQELVNVHTREDDGHWKWFLADLVTLGHDTPLSLGDAVRFIWSDATVRMRMLSYHLCRLGLGADSIKKLVLIYCIESTFRVTINNVAPVADEFTVRTGKKLVFFGRHHSEFESGHTLLDPKIHRMIEDLQLEPNRSSELSSMVDECFGLFTAFTDELMDFAKGQLTSGRT